MAKDCMYGVTGDRYSNSKDGKVTLVKKGPLGKTRKGRG